MSTDKATHCVFLVDKETGAKKLEFKGTAEACVWYCAIFENDLKGLDASAALIMEEIELGKYDGGLMLEELLGTPIRRK